MQLNQPVAAAELAAHFDGLTYSYLLLLWPLVALTGPFNMGVSFVMRNWARDEHSFLLSDFKDALRSKLEAGPALRRADGFVPLALYLCARFYAGMAAASPLFYLPLAVVAIAAARLVSDLSAAADDDRHLSSKLWRTAQKRRIDYARFPAPRHRRAAGHAASADAGSCQRPCSSPAR